MVMYIQLCTIHFTPVRPAGVGIRRSPLRAASRSVCGANLECRPLGFYLLLNIKRDNPCPSLDH